MFEHFTITKQRKEVTTTTKKTLHASDDIKSPGAETLDYVRSRFLIEKKANHALTRQYLPLCWWTEHANQRFSVLILFNQRFISLYMNNNNNNNPLKAQSG
jgi:hypothetical protein